MTDQLPPPVVNLVDLVGLRRRMEDHDSIRGEAIVLLTAREVYDLLEFIAALQSQLAVEQECCCSIDWDDRCSVHGPDFEDDD